VVERNVYGHFKSFLNFPAPLKREKVFRVPFQVFSKALIRRFLNT
jgi:hypothetical protein